MNNHLIRTLRTWTPTEASVLVEHDAILSDRLDDLDEHTWVDDLTSKEQETFAKLLREYLENTPGLAIPNPVEVWIDCEFGYESEYDSISNEVADQLTIACEDSTPTHVIVKFAEDDAFIGLFEVSRENEYKRKILVHNDFTGVSEFFTVEYILEGTRYLHTRITNHQTGETICRTCNEV